MNLTPQSVAARRYLLGQVTDAECETIEREYLEREDAFDRIAAAEDDLIEDYLSDQLTPLDRTTFERHYLSTPAHRVRVETVRRLMVQASRSAPMPGHGADDSTSMRWAPSWQWLALAASVILVSALVLSIVSPSGADRVQRADTLAPTAEPVRQLPASSAESPRPAPKPPRVLALAIAPVAVRSASDALSVTVPRGTDIVAIALQAEADGRALVPRRIAITTVGGDPVWQGPVRDVRQARRGAVARGDVPADRLPGGDYVITLYGSDASGEQEWADYFLRVRAR